MLIVMKVLAFTSRNKLMDMYRRSVAALTESTQDYRLCVFPEHEVYGCP